jgi:single-stranded-DNA-specific exonuclease
VKDHHIKFSIRQNDISFTGIGFQMATKFSMIESNEPFDVVYTIEENEWNNRRQLQLKIIDFRPANKKAPADPGLSN